MILIEFGVKDGENILAVPLNNLLNESKTALKTENSNVDITLSALKDAITKTGETVKTLADVVDALSNVTIGSALPEGTNVVGAVVNKNADGDEIFTSENPGSMQLTGSNVAEQLTQDDAVANVLTFSENISAIEIYHDEAIWQEFIVNGLTVTVPAGGWARPIGGIPSTEVTIPAISCIVGRLV